MIFFQIYNSHLQRLSYYIIISVWWQMVTVDHQQVPSWFSVPRRVAATQLVPSHGDVELL